MTESLQKYLHRRPNSPNFLVRLPVPVHLQKIIKKREITKSMKTSDRKIAEKNAMRFIADQMVWFEKCTEAEDGIVLSDWNSIIVAIYYDDALEKFVSLMKTAAKNGTEALEAWARKYTLLLNEYKRLLLVEDSSKMKASGQKLVLKHGFPIGFESEEFQCILKRIMESFIAALGVVVGRAGGELDTQPSSAFVLQSKSERSKIAKKGERISDHLTKYLTEQNEEHGRNLSNLKQSAAIIETFAEWIGDSREIAAITKREAAAFRGIISKIPKSRGISKKLAGLSINNAISIAEKLSLPLLSPATKSRYISDLSSFFKWLRQRGLCNENIWEGLSFQFDKEERKRHPFTTEQLNQLLSSPLYAGFLCDKKEHLPGEQKAQNWRHWIPLLCMFTGARITEIAQLYVDDIAEKDGCLVGYIKVNKDRGQSVKTKKSRLVVFHSTLLAAGFKDYWQQQSERSKTDGNQQLFPELIAKGRPERGTGPAKWFRTYLTRIGIKNGDDGLGAHAFRHRLSDEMRKAGYLNSDFGQLVMGHSDRSMTARYGDENQGTIVMLRDMIEKAEFKGVDFSKIIAGNGNK